MVWQDYGARNYEASIGRWMNIDPLASKYYKISPYVYVASNPVMFIDPNGKEIIIPYVGNKNSSKNVRNKVEIYQNLQKLTNDKIKLVETRKGYRVLIVKGETTNSDKNLIEGTKLVSELIKSKKKISIKTGKENRIDKSKNGNSNITFDPNNEADGTKGNAIQNEDGSYGRPVEIGLAHELIHADLNAKNKVDKTEVTVINPDKPYQGEKVTTDQDELNVRETENKIREEQKVKARKKLEKI